MDLEKIGENLEKIKLEKETKKAILNLIDTKINNDMKEVISEIKSLNIKLDTSIEALRSENSNIKWLIGIVGAIAAAILAKVFKMF